MKKYVGIDIGGTTIKGIIAGDGGELLAEDSVKTGGGGDGLVAGICELVNKMLLNTGATNADICGLGVGCPGLIGEGGEIIFAGNLKVKNYPLGARLKEQFGCAVRITNDANAAALGEAKFGAGAEYKDSVFITLGTGVGGGIIIGGKLFEGNRAAGAELGHMVIKEGGEACTCGRRGCFEAYASATALIRITKDAMQKNPHSAMWQGNTLDTVNGKTAFDYPEDEAAKRVVETYLDYLTCGLVNLANIFRPQVIIIGGGISGQGERLSSALQKKLDAQLFGGTRYAPVKVVCAALGNRAGAFGAASLLME